MREKVPLPGKTNLLIRVDRFFKYFLKTGRLYRRSRRVSRRSNRSGSAHLPKTFRRSNVQDNRYAEANDLILFSAAAIIIYHPFRVTRDPQYWKMLGRLKPGQREQFRTLWKKNEEQHYCDKRRAQLNENFLSYETELVVARSPKEFCAKIFRQFAQGEGQQLKNE